MKKIVCFLLLSFGFSCSLDIPVEDEITGLNAIDNILIANETLSSVYKAYPKNKIILSKLADDFYPNHTISDNKSDYDLYQWKKQELVILSNSLWENYYDTIGKANVLLNRIPFINVTTAEEKQELNFIYAQTLSLKALSYFELLQMYASTYSSSTKEDLGIILKDKIASEELPRATLENSYKEVEKLLLKAISLFPNNTKTNFRFSNSSAKVLLAKIYLNWNKYEKAITICNELLAIASINKTNYTNLWKTPKNNPEVLLVFENELFNYSPIVDGVAHDDEFYINFYINYDATDYRKNINFIEANFRLLDNSTIKATFLGKNRKVLFDEKPTPIISIRQAELYFIKAESLYKLSRENEAKNTLNTFLDLRKAININSTGITFLSDLLKEKQKEFLGEGLRYFDAKRNHIQLTKVNFRNHNSTNKILANDYRWLLAIPKNEIQQNNNVKQNPNW